MTQCQCLIKRKKESERQGKEGGRYLFLFPNVNNILGNQGGKEKKKEIEISRILSILRLGSRLGHAFYYM